MMQFEVEATVASCFGLPAVPAARLTRVVVAFEHLLPQSVGVQALRRLSAIDWIGRKQPILGGAKGQIIDVCLDRPTVLIPQFPQTPTALLDPADVVDLIARDRSPH